MTTVLVCIPFHNRIKPEELKSSIDSILQQTFKDFRLILIQDGFVSDEVKDIVQKYVQANKEIKFIKFGESKGLVNALNYAIDFEDYKFFARMDADDISVINRFEMQVAFLNVNSEIEVLGGSVNEFQHNPLDGQVRKMPLTHRDIIEKYHFVNPIIHPSVMIRKSFFDRVGYYDPNYYRTEDLELWGRGIAAGVKFANLEAVVINFRLTGMFARRKSIKAIIDQVRARHAYRSKTWIQRIKKGLSILYRMSPIFIQARFYKILKSFASR